MEEQLIWCWSVGSTGKSAVFVMPFPEYMVWAAADKSPDRIYFFASKAEVPEGIIA